MIINTNMASLNTVRQLGVNEKATQSSLAKLSSGLKINTAADDAAGLAISEKMRGQISGLNKASSNAQDGISMVATAEGSLSETTSILQRMRELAVQGSNDTNTTDDRTAMQTEMNQLTSEVNRIGNTTEFNTQKLLNGSGTQIMPSAVTTTTPGAAKGQISAVNTVTTAVKGAQAVYTVALTADATLTSTPGEFTMDLNSDGTNDVDITGVTASTDLETKLNANTAFSNNFVASGAADGTITITARTAAAGGAYDGNAGNHVVAGGSAYDSSTGTTVVTNGATEVRGKYTLSIDQALAVAGDSMSIKAGSGSAVAYAISGTNAGVGATKEQQAATLAGLMNTDNAANHVGNQFTVTAVGSQLVFEDKAGSADPAKALNISAALSTTAVAGHSNFSASTLVAAGGKFTIDGTDIKVTSDTTDIGLKNGTAMLAADDANSQATNIVAAINLNSTLRTKYSATVDSTTKSQVDLVQASTQETSNAPVVSSASKDGIFSAKFQIGANTGQTMTVDIKDMRSEALGISGTTASATATASNGSKASFTAAVSASNGTDNTNTEYTLDLSTADKATAAISVIDDAITKVSAERSNLGAVQNRLEHTINNLGTSSQNITSAEANIRDVDMAKEMTNFQKNNILQQAAQAMLAQANQQGQGVLQLLR